MSLIETYSKVRIYKNLSDTSAIQNSLKQGDALSPVLFNFVLEYFISKAQKQAGLKLNGIHQFLVYADDVNLLGGNVNPMKKYIYALIGASKEVSLKVNIEKTKYALIFRLQNVGYDQNIKIGNRSCNIVAKLRYLRRQ
jgi:hypothetical protein